MKRLANVGKIVQALDDMLQAENRLHQLLKDAGLTCEDLMRGLRRKAPQCKLHFKASSTDELFAAIKARPRLSRLTADSAFAMMPPSVQKRIETPRGMAAAIRVLHKRGVLQRSGVDDGVWIVTRFRNRLDA